MGFLQNILHDIQGGAKAVGKAIPIAVSDIQPISDSIQQTQHTYVSPGPNLMTGTPSPHGLPARQYNKALGQLSHMPYAQYMNPNDIGGGFGPIRPMHGSLGPQASPYIQGAQNPGFIPMQGSGYSQSGIGFARGYQPAATQTMQNANGYSIQNPTISF